LSHSDFTEIIMRIIIFVRRWTGLASISASSFIMPCLGNEINVAAPAISYALKVPADYVALLQMALALAAGSLAIPMGRLGDVLGRAFVYRLGLAIILASSLAASLSPAPIALMAFSIAIGVGAAMIFGTNYAILASIYPQGELGRAIGINTLAVYTGLTSGPLIGGLLASIDWRYIFLVNAAPAALSLALSGDIPADRYRERGYDAVGAALLASSLSLSVWGLTYDIYLTALGLALLALFAAYEINRAKPLIEPSIFRRFRFTAASVAAMLNYAATFAVTYVLSLYLHMRGIPPAYAGLLLLPQPLLMAIFAPISGRISDYVEPGLVSSMGMGTAAVALALMASMTASTPLWSLELELALLGLGFAFFISPNTYMIIGSVEPRHHGVASSVVAVVRLVGQSLSMAIAAYVLASTGDLLLGIRESLAVLAAISVAAAALSLARIRKPIVLKRR